MSSEPQVVPVEVVTLDGVEVEAPPEQVVRYLGYPVGVQPSPQVAERARQASDQAHGKTRPRGIYSLYPVLSWDKRSIALDRGDTFTGPIGEFLGHSEQVAVFVATAGREVVELGERAAQDGDVLGNLAFHALGAALAEAMVERLVDHLRARIPPGTALTLRYSPGYCGISLKQQQKLFRLVPADRIGVELLPTMIMKPIKSVSGLIGIGPAPAIKAYGNPCSRCPLKDCAMRR